MMMEIMEVVVNLETHDAALLNETQRKLCCPFDSLFLLETFSNYYLLSVEIFCFCSEMILLQHEMGSEDYAKEVEEVCLLVPFEDIAQNDYLYALLKRRIFCLREQTR